MAKGWQDETSVITKEEEKRAAQETKRLVAMDILKLKKIKLGLEADNRELMDKRKEISNEKNQELIAIKQTLADSQKELNALISENNTLNRAVQKRIADANEKEAKADNTLKATDKARNNYLAQIAANDQKLAKALDGVKADKKEGAEYEQSLNQREFSLDNREKDISKKDSAVTDKEIAFNLKKKQLQDDERAVRDRETIAEDTIIKADKFLGDAKNAQGLADDLIHKANTKMAEALLKEQDSLERSLQNKNMKKKLDEKEEDLKIWEKANKVEEARLRRKQELMRKGDK